MSQRTYIYSSNFQKNEYQKSTTTVIENRRQKPNVITIGEKKVTFQNGPSINKLNHSRSEVKLNIKPSLKVNNLNNKTTVVTKSSDKENKNNKETINHSSKNTVHYISGSNNLGQKSEKEQNTTKKYGGYKVEVKPRTNANTTKTNNTVFYSSYKGPAKENTKKNNNTTTIIVEKRSAYKPKDTSIKSEVVTVKTTNNNKEIKDYKNNRIINKNAEENKNKSKETSIKSEVISTRTKNDSKDAKNYNNVTMKNSEDNKNISKEKVIKTEVVTVNTKIENIDVGNRGDRYKKNIEEKKSIPKERIVKTEIVTVKTNIDNQGKKDDILKNNNINKNKEKVEQNTKNNNYKYTREKLTEKNKTDDSLNTANYRRKEKEKEIINVEDKKRNSYVISYIPGSESKILFISKNEQKKDEKNNVNYSKYKISNNKNETIMTEEKNKENINNKRNQKENNNVTEMMGVQKIEKKGILHNKRIGDITNKPEKKVIIVEQRREEMNNKPIINVQREDKKINKLIEQKKNLKFNESIITDTINKEEKEETKNDKEINEKEKLEKTNGLKIALNEIEKESVDHILNKDLVEMFQEVIENNFEFKNDIFFKNLIDTEKKVAIMDNAKISQFESTYKNYENMNDLMKKYTKRARIIVDED